MHGGSKKKCSTVCDLKSDKKQPKVSKKTVNLKSDFVECRNTHTHIVASSNNFPVFSACHRCVARGSLPRFLLSSCQVVLEPARQTANSHLSGWKFAERMPTCIWNGFPPQLHHNCFHQDSPLPNARVAWNFAWHVLVSTCLATPWPMLS